MQRLFFELQSFGRTYPFGGLPGRGEPYGFCSVGANGSLYTLVNPSQSRRVITLPRLHRLQTPLQPGAIQFRDGGFEPMLSTASNGTGTVEVTVGPEQLLVIGFGEFAKTQYNLGIQEDVSIPKNISPIPCDFRPDGSNAVSTTIHIPSTAKVRIKHSGSQGRGLRSQLILEALKIVLSRARSEALRSSENFTS